MDVKRKTSLPRALVFFTRPERLSAGIFLLSPILMFTLVEYLNNNLAWRFFSPAQILLNLLFYYIIYGLTLLAVGRYKLAAGAASLFFYLIGTVNHYVYAFRGRTIFPGDLLTLRTAANVADNYDYTPSQAQLITGAIFAVYILALVIIPRQRGRVKIPLPARVAVPVLSCVYIALFFFTSFVSSAGIEPSMWTTRGNGLVLNFCVSLRYSVGDQPEGYGVQALARLALDTPEAAAGEEEPPANVIVVMNESFADLGVLGDFPTNADWMPFYRSLTENCIKGWAYSSVFGGTTANAEYEFLTGNSIAFVPPGVVPYQLYINGDTASLAGQMKELGYTCVAMHPYLESGWNRVPVYNRLGFDRLMFKDDFTNKRYMRNYVTDRSNYENLIQVLREKQRGGPLFIFNITMQNHSSYTVEPRGLPQTVRLAGEMTNYYPTVDQFLSLMRESDSALEYLIDSLSQIQERTMVLFFGDHQPQVAPSFFELMLGGPLDRLGPQALQTRQMVPFFIWANYDLPEESGLELSMNYLASLLMEKANLPLTGYQRYLLALSRDLPVINSVGYKDSDGHYYESADQLSPERRARVEDYQILQYCNIFDPQSMADAYFCLE